jgi:hypothetical protein
VVSLNPQGITLATGLYDDGCIRMSMRRFTRLTNGFSKKIANHEAAIALHFTYYNFCRIHKTLRVKPAMEAGLSDYVWEIGELVSLTEPRSILDGLKLA